MTTTRSIDADALYDGAWLRAFDYGRWEYFGSSADIGWGPYCAETGWMCAPLGLGLLLETAPGPPLCLPARPEAGPRPEAHAAAARARAEADAVEQALCRAPEPVGSLRALPSSGPYVRLTWAVPALPALTYRVHRATGSDCTPSPGNLVAKTGTGAWTDLQLAPSTLYAYRVVAANGLGQSAAPSAVVTVTTGPPSKLASCRYRKAPAPYASFPDAGETESTDGVYAGLYGDGKSYGYRLAEVGQRIDQSAEGLGLPGGEAGRRLVQQEQAGPESQGSGDLHEALLAGREGRRRLGLPVGKADELERGERLGP